MGRTPTVCTFNVRVTEVPGPPPPSHHRVITVMTEVSHTRLEVVTEVSHGDDRGRSLLSGGDVTEVGHHGDVTWSVDRGTPPLGHQCVFTREDAGWVTPGSR